MELNKIYNEDCLIGMQQIKSGAIDAIITDLPYGTTKCAWDAVIPFDKLWEQYNRVIKHNGAIVLFGAEPFSSHLRLSNLRHFKYDIVWDKVKGTGFLNAKKQPMRNHEIISVFYKIQCTYNPQKTTGHEKKASFKRKHLQTDVYGKMNGDTLYSSTDRYPRSIQQFSADTQTSSLHPTQKPVSLIEWLIKTYTNEGETVLDNCMGSGTTAIACINTNRNYIGFETDKEYYGICNNRINDHLAGKKSELFQ
jgi:DNA modification methylase